LKDFEEVFLLGIVLFEDEHPKNKKAKTKTQSVDFIYFTIILILRL
jgi:hypothetical protein